ncbi:MAG: hypothetical protein AAGA44_15220 [Pseudomonadota bacterium]
MEKIIPHKSAGRVVLGMTRAEVCALFDQPPRTYLKTPKSSSETFAFGDGAISVFFSADDDTVKFIELASSGHGSFSIDGIDVFLTRANDLIEKLGERYNLRVTEGGCSVVLEDQDVSFWRSDTDSTYFDAIGIGAPNYFAEL